MAWKHVLKTSGNEPLVLDSLLRDLCDFGQSNGWPEHTQVLRWAREQCWLKVMVRPDPGGYDIFLDEEIGRVGLGLLMMGGGT